MTHLLALLLGCALTWLVMRRRSHKPRRKGPRPPPAAPSPKRVHLPPFDLAFKVEGTEKARADFETLRLKHPRLTADELNWLMALDMADTKRAFVGLEAAHDEIVEALSGKGRP